MPHVITETELLNWMLDHWVTFASSADANTGSNKSFEIKFDGLYRVKNQLKEIYIGRDRNAAILIYNDCR